MILINDGDYYNGIGDIDDDDIDVLWSWCIWGKLWSLGGYNQKVINDVDDDGSGDTDDYDIEVLWSWSI